jgi:hypothetical protein
VIFSIFGGKYGQSLVQKEETRLSQNKRLQQHFDSLTVGCEVIESWLLDLSSTKKRGQSGRRMNLISRGLIISREALSVKKDKGHQLQKFPP